MNEYEDYDEFFTEWKYGNTLNIPVKVYYFKDDDNQAEVIFAQERKEKLVSAYIKAIAKNVLDEWWEKAKSKRDEKIVVI